MFPSLFSRCKHSKLILRWTINPFKSNVCLIKKPVTLLTVESSRSLSIYWSIFDFHQLQYRRWLFQLFSCFPEKLLKQCEFVNILCGVFINTDMWGCNVQVALLLPLNIILSIGLYDRIINFLFFISFFTLWYERVSVVFRKILREC